VLRSRSRSSSLCSAFMPSSSSSRTFLATALKTWSKPAARRSVWLWLTLRTATASAVAVTYCSRVEIVPPRKNGVLRWAAGPHGARVNQAGRRVRGVLPGRGTAVSVWHGHRHYRLSHRPWSFPRGSCPARSCCPSWPGGDMRTPAFFSKRSACMGSVVAVAVVAVAAVIVVVAVVVVI
jgi:hypothetical protein